MTHSPSCGGSSRPSAATYQATGLPQGRLGPWPARRVESPERGKLPPLPRLPYRDPIANTVADPGQPEEISEAFAGFQKHPYSGADA